MSLDRRALLRRTVLGAGLVAAAPLTGQHAFGASTTTTVPGEMLSFARVRPRTLKQAQALMAFDDTHRLLADGTMELLLWPGDRTRLDRLGVDYREFAPQQDAPAKGRPTGLALQPGERSGYRRLADYYTDMQSLATRNPSRARMFTFKEPSLEGRPMYGLEIADDVARANADGRPTFWVDGVHHAREWPSSEYTIMFAFDLLTSRDPRITALLKRVKVVVVPVVNPDGFTHSRDGLINGTPADRELLALASMDTYWRKNKRSATNALYAGGETQSYLNADAHGVDPNRNYAFYWGGEGGGGDPTSQTYGGSAPFSEPEARNIAGVMKAQQVTAYLTNHTSGELCMRPWGYTEAPSPDNDLQEDLGERMCSFHGYRNQIGLSLYPTAGTSRDWSYGALRTLVYTFEHNQEFHPDYGSEIPSTYAKNRGAWLLLAEAAADRRNHGTITGRVVNRAGAPVSGATVVLSKSFRTPTAVEVTARKDGGVPESIRSTLKTGRDGRFTVHANPSTRPTTIQDRRPRETWTVSVGAFRKAVFLDRGTRVDLGTIKS